MQLFISKMPKMCAIPQLVSAPLNPIPTVEHFRRSYPKCECSYGQHKFANVKTIHCHNLLGAQYNLFIPRPNTEALKKSFRYKGAVTWNSLSVEAKQATTLNSFYSAIV